MSDFSNLTPEQKTEARREAGRKAMAKRWQKEPTVVETRDVQEQRDESLNWPPEGEKPQPPPPPKKPEQVEVRVVYRPPTLTEALGIIEAALQKDYTGWFIYGPAWQRIKRQLSNS